MKILKCFKVAAR